MKKSFTTKQNKRFLPSSRHDATRALRFPPPLVDPDVHDDGGYVVGVHPSVLGAFARVDAHAFRRALRRDEAANSSSGFFRGEAIPNPVAARHDPSARAERHDDGAYLGRRHARARAPAIADRSRNAVALPRAGKHAGFRKRFSLLVLVVPDEGHARQVDSSKHYRFGVTVERTELVLVLVSISLVLARIRSLRRGFEFVDAQTVPVARLALRRQLRARRFFFFFGALVEARHDRVVHQTTHVDARERDGRALDHRLRHGGRAVGAVAARAALRAGRTLGYGAELAEVLERNRGLARLRHRARGSH